MMDRRDEVEKLVSPSAFACVSPYLLDLTQVFQAVVLVVFILHLVLTLLKGWYIAGFGRFYFIGID